jgi:hypothetical protein
MTTPNVATIGIDLALGHAGEVVRDLNDVTSAGSRTERSLKDLRSSTDNLTASQRALAQQGVSLEDVLAAVNQETVKATKAKNDDRVATESLNAARRAQVQLGEQMAAAIQRERAMLLAHGEALELNARRNATLAAAAKSTGASINTLRGPLTAATAQLLSLNPAAATTASVLGNFALGAAPMVAILAGVAALGFAWNKLTEDARKAREEHERLRKVLVDAAKERKLGPLGDFGAGTSESQQRLATLQRELADLLAKRAALAANPQGGGVGGVFAGGGGTAVEIGALDRRAKALRENIAAEQELTRAGQAHVVQMVQQATLTEATTRNNIARQRELANTMVLLGNALQDEQLKRDLINNSYDLQNKLIENQANLTGVQRAQADASAKALKAVSDEQAHFNDNLRKFSVVQQAIKDLEDYRKTIQGLHLTLGAITTTPAGAGGFTLLSGGSTKETPEERSARDAREKSAAYLLSRERESLIIADATTRTIADQARLVEQTAGAAADFAVAMGLADQRSANLIRNVAQAAGGIALLRDAVNRKSDGSGSTSGVLLASLPVIGSASTIGAASPSNVGAGLGGAAAGAAAGAAIGSVVPILGTAIGAVIGGVGGLALGLFGHAGKIKEARREYEKTETDFVAGLRSYTSQYAQQFAGIDKAFKDLEDAAKAAHVSVSGEARAARDAARARIITDFSASIGEQFNALAGPMGEYLNQQNAIIKKYIEQRDAAIALGASQEDLTRIEALRELQLAALRNELEKAASAPLLSRYQSLTGASSPYQSGSVTLAPESEYLRPLFDKFNNYLDGLQKLKDAAESSAFFDQIQASIAQQQLQVSQESLRVSEASVGELQQTLDSLRRASSSLALGSNSPLNARQRYHVAENDLESQFQIALGGGASGQKAAQGIGSYIDSFLGISKERFASGTPYSSDYNRAQSMLDALEGIYGPQLTTEEKTLAELKKHTDLLTKQLDTSKNSLVEQLVARANTTTDSNEIMRIIATLKGLGYQLGRDVGPRCRTA